MIDVKIIIHSELVSQYYAQTLCLLLWPRAKFHENLPINHIPAVEIWEDCNDNKYFAKIKITTNDGTFSGEYILDKSEKLYMEDSALAVGKAFFTAAKQCGLHDKAWGLLTGVRPAKPLLSALLSNKSIDNAYSLMTEKYLVHPDKALLTIDVAKSEYKCVKDIKNNAVSIYISIPFCPTRCSYCSFVSYAKPNLMVLIPEYLTHLCSDIKRIANMVKTLALHTVSIYVGGGTPTTLNEQQLELLCKTITESFDMDTVMEFSVEAGRPDTITKTKLEIMKKYGVGRISINPQTLHDKTLEVIGRKHNTNDFYKAYYLAKEVGFNSINTDLILSLPNESGNDFIESVNGILNLAPENLTIHSFCIKKSADLASLPDSLPSDEILPFQKKAIDEVIKNNYHPYYIYRQKNAVGDLENIGFSKKGFECIYNIAMMEEIHSVIGIGAGASTRLVSNDGTVISRHYAPKYPFEYKNFDINDTIDYISKFYQLNN